MSRVRLFLLGVLALAAPARAQEAVTLAPAHKAGERWTFEESSETSTSLKVMADGKLAQQQDTKQRELRRGVLDVLKVANGEPSAVRATYDPASAEEAEQTGAPPQKRAYGFAGQTVTIRRGAGGATTVECPAALQDEERKTLEGLVDSEDRNFYPKKPVKPGDRWLVEEKAVAKAFKLGEKDRGLLKCRLKSLEGGRGTIELSLGISKVMEDWLNVQVDMEGTGVVDIATGQFTSLELSGPISISGSRDVPAEGGKTVKIDVDGSGTSSFKTIVAPAAPGAAPAPGATTPSAPPPQPPAPQPPGAAATPVGPVEAGIAKGVVTDGQGRPLAGVEVWVSSSVFARSNMHAKTGPDGRYRFDLPAPNVWSATAYLKKPFNGKTYCFVLCPDRDDSFSSENGVVRNFTWKMSGAKPDGTDTSQFLSYFGAGVEFAPGDMNNPVDIRFVEVTLTPQGPLVDGSAGQTIRGAPSKWTWNIIGDVPIGRYAVTAELVAPNGQRGRLLLGPAWEGPFAPAYDLQFPSNEGGSCLAIQAKIYLNYGR